LLAKLESQIKVIHGVNDDTFDGLVGRPVAAVRQALAEAFGIPADAASFVNGERVGDDYILKTNDVLEFVRTSGVKPLAMRAKVIFDNGDALLFAENGHVFGEPRSFDGAIAFNKKGRKVNAYFLREVVMKPDTIPWKFRDGRQRTRLYDTDGNFLEGNYVVVREAPHQG
jgi:hypothetical protein